MVWIIIIIIVGLSIPALLTISLSVVLSNILPTKPPIGALIITAGTEFLFVGWPALSTWGLCGLHTSNFNFAPYHRYIEVYKLFGIQAMIFGLIVSGSVYAGARIWRVQILPRPISVATSIGLLLLAFIMIIGGLYYFGFLIAMFVDETNLCK